MIRFACVINAICIGGMCVLLYAVGSSDDPLGDTVTAPPMVKAPTVVLADGMWGNYNEGMAEQCASAALLQGKTHKMSPQAIDGLFNECVFNQGLTI